MLLCFSVFIVTAAANHLAPAGHQHGEVLTDSEGVRLALMVLLVMAIMLLPAIYFLVHNTRLADR